MNFQYSSKTIIYIALGANVLVSGIKFSAAAWTGSSAMFSAGVYSAVDIGNELLLLYGLHRAEARPNRDHPMGFGREVYFWSFAVALLVFAFGAVVSLNEGVTHVMNPTTIQSPAANYVVLAFSAVIDGISWWIELHAFKGARRYSEVFGAILRSKDPPSFVVLFEDSAALVGLVITFFGIYLSISLKLPVFDGIASVLLGLVLAATAVLLAKETKSLLIGERADQDIVDSITEIAETIEGVERANGILTVHLGPKQIVAALSLKFDDALKTPQIEEKVVELEHRLQVKHPEVIALFVKPQRFVEFQESVKRRFGTPNEE